ncbi:MAG: alpha-L-fucosidase [Actinomycetota bacterium]|nr:alpha-L-fucosidase [Actinomycetota bacterium]
MPELDRAWKSVRAWIPELCRGIIAFASGLASPRRRVPSEEWWHRPGWGIMYQIEHRPGWDWDRDYDEFNASMRDGRGDFSFNGPLCEVEEWMDLSREVGVDFHVMEAKWHDGICFFDSELTDWKSDRDYAAAFSALSRDAGIPFLYYYSSVFDHNPRFDSVQPNRHKTFSIIALGGQPVYEEYLRGQYRELVERYSPDGMWVDWYWPGDAATEITIEFFRDAYPGVILGFNMSNYLAGSYKRLDYAIGEAHELDGPLVKIRRTGAMFIPVICSTWKWTAIFRRMLDVPWELVAPAGRWWQDPRRREDPYELVRMAAVVMAGGGRFSLGTTVMMDGRVVPSQAKQLRMLGDWYRPRRRLFSEALPLGYRGREPNGVKVRSSKVKAVATRREDGVILHLINMDGGTRSLQLTLQGEPWTAASSILLEPGGWELEAKRTLSRVHINIRPEDLDPVDTILRFPLWK